jgi:hypothetical protein
MDDNGLFFTTRCDFIAKTVVQYLGVRSLIRFGAVCKSHKQLVAMEVERRKNRIAEVENDVQRLTMTGQEHQSPPCVPTRTNINEARKLVINVRRLISYDYFYDVYGDEFCSREQNPFHDETSKFHGLKVIGSLYTLPDCFYFPPEGESGIPSEEHIEALLRNWKEMDHRIPDESVQQRNVDNLVYEIVNRRIVDSFRVAARILYVNSNYNRYKLYKALLKADDLSSNMLEDAIIDVPPSLTLPPLRGGFRHGLFSAVHSCVQGLPTSGLEQKLVEIAQNHMSKLNLTKLEESIYIFTMMRILHCECEDTTVDNSEDNAEVMDLKWKEDEIKSQLSYAQFLHYNSKDAANAGVELIKLWHIAAKGAMSRIDVMETGIIQSLGHDFIVAVERFWVGL